jgi:benzil reductase ((S)-benzoin forming)
MKITENSISIITGATGGLGQSIAQFINNKKGSLILIARNAEKLKSIQEGLNSDNGAVVETIAADLSVENDLLSIEKNLIKIFEKHKDVNEIFVFNNASIIDPIKLIEDISFNEIRDALTLNIVSPLLLSSMMIRLKKKIDLPRINFIHISSGVSLYPVVGWSAYCISKAGLNMPSKCISAEGAQERLDIFSISLNPGAINTAMQAKIRNADGDKVPATKKFETLYNDGKLQQPDAVAEKIFRLLEKGEYVNGDFIDLNLIG